MFINIHSHHPSANGELTIMQAGISIPEKGFFSAGIHPMDSHSEDLFNHLEAAVALPHCLAVGECGLDRNLSIPIEDQTSCFLIQIDLARKYAKPLIIHCVRAYDEIGIVAHKSKGTGVWIMHRYNGNRQQTEMLLKNPLIRFSFGPECIRHPKKTQELLGLIPASRLFLETDESSVSIQEVYGMVQGFLNLGAEDLERQLETNFSRDLGHAKLE